jgi:hypothetical protein
MDLFFGVFIQLLMNVFGNWDFQARGEFHAGSHHEEIGGYITLGDTQEKICPLLVRTASLETLQKADTRARQWKVAGSASQA